MVLREWEIGWIWWMWGSFVSQVAELLLIYPGNTWTSILMKQNTSGILLKWIYISSSCWKLTRFCQWRTNRQSPSTSDGAVLDLESICVLRRDQAIGPIVNDPFFIIRQYTFKNFADVKSYTTQGIQLIHFTEDISPTNWYHHSTIKTRSFIPRSVILAAVWAALTKSHFNH